MLYSSSFVGTLKNEIPEAALELCQLKIKQLSPDILKFRTKHEDNPFTLNCSVVPCSFLFVFHTGSRRLGSNNSRNSSYKEKKPGSARVPRLSFRFLWLCFHLHILFSLVPRKVFLSRKITSINLMWIINTLACLLSSCTSDSQEINLINLVSWFNNKPKSKKCNQREVLLQRYFRP